MVPWLSGCSVISLEENLWNLGVKFFQPFRDILMFFRESFYGAVAYGNLKDRGACDI